MTDLTTTQAGVQITRDNYHWGTTLGAAQGPISFGFRTSAPGYSVSGENVQGTFTAFSAAEEAAARAALALWASVANITFTDLGDTNSATIEFANYRSSTDQSEAFAFYPVPIADTSSGGYMGDVFVNTYYASTTNDNPGTYEFMTFIHEIGHALGLEHPGNYNAGPGQTITYANSAAYVEDTRMYTLMSYFAETNTGGHFSVYNESPMLADIAAIQRLYGANLTTRAGDSTYGFNSNAGSPFAISSASQHVVFTIWDGGGNDTIDFSGYSQNQTIDMNADHFSSVGGDTYNVSIALGVTIEAAIGGAGADTITGNAADNTINGGAGADTMSGGLGNDTYVVDNVNDHVIENASEGTDTVSASVSFTLAANVENLTLTGSANISGTGNSADNTIIGNFGSNTLYGLDGNDSIDGGAGADTMIGGAGSDTYYVDHASDIVTENANEGTDTVNASVTFTLGANVEYLTLTGTADLQGYGNSLVNIIYGNSGNNLLDGGAGADVMYGGAGNDAYFVDNPGDQVVENASEGTDTVYSTAHLRLGADIEVLVLQGSADLQGYGNAQLNVIYGTSGSNILDGGAGTDALYGGAGNDAYYVDNPGDNVIEYANEGMDTIYSTAHLRIGPNIENLVLQGTADLQGYGNDLVNVINGNSGSNIIDGGIGADTMYGGAGNDYYYVDNPADTVIEYANEGIDDVYSSAHLVLGANIEYLHLIGTADLQGYGNALNNILVGNSGANILDGRGGADMLYGYGGNDTFFFRAGQANGDTIVDFDGNGAALGDRLLFADYGAGASFTQNDATHWQIDYNAGASHEVITFANAAAIHPTDYSWM